MTTDPFTTAAGAVLGALRCSSPFMSIVRPGNLIDMTADTFERFKSQLQFNDTPEVVLLQDDFRLQPYGPASNSALLEQSFLLVSTLDSLKSRTLNVLKFQTLAALAKAGPTLGLDGLVQSWEIASCRDDALSNTTPSFPWKRGSQRWVSLLTISVKMLLSRQQLISLG